MLLLAYAVFLIFKAFLVPLGWAAVLVVVFHPWHRRLEQRWGANRAALISTLAITLILVVPAMALLTAFVQQGIEAARSARDALEGSGVTSIQDAREWVQARFPALAQYDLAQVARQAAERVGAFFAARAGDLLKNVAVFFFDLFVMLFALFFFFRDRAELLASLRGLLPFGDEEVSEIFENAHELIQTSVTASFIIAGLQGLLGGITFALLGIGGAVFWGVTMAFLALIPLLGTGVVIAPTVLWLLISGQVTKGIILAIVGVALIGTVDNLLRPFLAAGRTQMSALVLFIAVLGGVNVFGMLGLVMGPIVLATARSLLAVYGKQHGTAGGDSKQQSAGPVLELPASEQEKA